MRKWGVQLVVFLLAAACSATIVALTLEVSAARGRLAGPPVVDNVIYMARGAIWLRAFRAGGVGAVVSEYWANPPHAPYSCALAFVAYLLGGVKDSMPAGSSLIVPLIGLFAAGMCARRAGAVTAGLCVVLAACAPMWVASIEIFKPDYMAGVLTAIACVLAIRLPGAITEANRLAGSDGYRMRVEAARLRAMSSRTHAERGGTREGDQEKEFGSSRRERSRGVVWWLGTGAMLGLALLAKPAVFPGTLMYFATAFMSSWLVQLRRDRGRWRECAAAGALVMIAALVVAGPHYAIAGRKTLRYIIENSAGDRSELWRMKGSWIDHGLFYLTGPSGSMMLGPWLWIAAIGACVCAAVVLRARWSAEQRQVERPGMWAWMRTAVPWVLSMLVSWGVPTLASVKIMEFAVCFQMPVVFGVCALVGRAGAAMSGRGWPMRGLVGVLIALAVATLRWRIPVEPTAVEPSTSGWAEGSESVGAKQRKVAERVYQAVLRAPVGEAGIERGVVCLIAGAPGVVNHNLFNLWAVRDGVRLSPFLAQTRLAPSELEHRLSLAMAVVVNNGFTGMTEDRRAPDGLNAEIRAMMQARADWRLMETIRVEGAEGQEASPVGVYEVYVRKDR